MILGNVSVLPVSSEYEVKNGARVHSVTFCDPSEEKVLVRPKRVGL